MNDILTQSTLPNNTVIRTRIERIGLLVEYVLDVSIPTISEGEFVVCQKRCTSSKRQAIKFHLDEVEFHVSRNVRRGLV
jgi:hypothetical protein